MHCWNEPQALQEAMVALSQAGLAATGTPEILRISHNAVVAVGDVVVRLSGPGDCSLAMVQREAALLQHCAEHGVPVAPVLAPPQKLPSGTIALLLGRLHETRAPTPEDAAVLAHQLHQVPPPPVLAPTLTFAPMLTRIQERLERLRAHAWLTADELAPLQDVYDRVAHWRQEQPASTLGVGLVHSDLHPGNILVTADGPVLLDFEYMTVTAREWDLMPAAASVRFDGRDGDNERFTAAYGYDVRDWDAFPDALDIKLLSATTWRLCLAMNEQDRRGGRDRLPYWTAPDTAAPWTAR